jgi:hypothetical protein
MRFVIAFIGLISLNEEKNQASQISGGSHYTLINNCPVKTGAIESSTICFKYFSSSILFNKKKH